MKRILLFVLFLLILTPGCIREALFSYDTAQLVSSQGVDVNKDGLFDITTYYYSPITLTSGKGELSIDRLIFVRPQEFSISAAGEESSKELWEARVAKALSTAEENVEDCRQVLCEAYSLCKARAGSEGEALTLFSFTRAFHDFDEAKVALSNALIRYSQGGELTALTSAMARLMVYEKVIAQHPAVAYFRVCRVRKGYGHYEPLKNITYTPSSHEALELVVFKGRGLESIAQITVKERFPFQISEKLEELKTTDAILKSRSPLVLEYSPFKLTKEDVASIGAMVSGTFENDKALFSYWRDLSINIRLALVELPFMDEFMATLGKIYAFFSKIGKPYLALALTFSAITAILLLIDGIGAFLYGLISLYFLKGVSLKRALRKAVGYVDPTWKRKLILGLILIAGGVVAELKAPLPSLTTFSLAEVRLALENPYAFASFILYFSGIYFILYVLRDRVRALLGGTVSKQRLKEKLEALEASIGEIKGMLDEMSSEGFDVSEEYEYILAIPLDKMKGMLGRNNARLANLLLEYSSRVDEIREKLKNRKKMAQSNWEEWEGYIREHLIDKNILPIDSLIAIPRPWRLWAVTRYIHEHPEENLYIEGKAIKREVLSEEEKIERLATRLINNELKALVVLKDNKVMYASSYPEDYLIKVLLYKIAEHAEGEALEATFKNSKLYMLTVGPYTAIGWGPKAKEGITFLLKRL